MGNGSLFSHLPSYEISVKLVLNKYYKQTEIEPGFNLKALQPPEFYPHLLHDTFLVFIAILYVFYLYKSFFLNYLI